MSVISAINNIKNQISGLDSSNKTSESNSSQSEDFGNILDSTIKETGLSSAITPTNIQNDFKEIFNELGIGIASSLVASLSGNMTASAGKAAESTSEIANDSATTDDSATSKTDSVNNEPAASGDDPTDIKNVLDSIALLTANKSISPEARNALSSLQDLLLKDNDTEKQSKS